MAIADYISTNQVFTSEELFRACGDNQTSANLLSRAVKSGTVTKVRRGLYVSNFGAFSTKDVSTYTIAEKAFDNPVFANASALELYGVSHNVIRSLVVCYASKPQSFTWQGIKFIALKRPKELEVRTYKGHLVTSREQTFIDCINRPELSGGLENVARSVSGLTLYLNHCIELASKHSRVSLQRCMVILKLLQAGDAKINDYYDSLKLAPYKSNCWIGLESSHYDKQFDSQYRVYYPKWLEEVCYEEAVDGYFL